MRETLTPMPQEDLLETGRCCGLGCALCPYFPRHQGEIDVDWPWVFFHKTHPEETYEDYQKKEAELSAQIAAVSRRKS